jgi:hypothetical protein
LDLFNWKLKSPVSKAKKTNKITMVDEEFQAISKLLISSSLNTEQSISLTNEIPEFQVGAKLFGEGFPTTIEIDQIFPREEILAEDTRKPPTVKNKSKKTTSSTTTNGSIITSSNDTTASDIHDLTHKRKELYTSDAVISNEKMATPNSSGSNTMESQLTIKSIVTNMDDTDDIVTQYTTVYNQDVINPHKFSKLNDIDENENVGDDHNVYP